MPGRPLGPLAVLLVAACAAGGTAPRAPGPVTRAGTEGAAPALVRVFEGAPEGAFWVSHGPDLDRIVSGGARLELAPSGEILDAAWELPLAHLVLGGDALGGALAVPARLGGGFVHWTRARVFRSGAFTGPLEAVALGAPGLAIRGARSGLSSVLVFTDAGPRELRPGALGLVPLAEPGVLDAAALDASRGARLDVFGRVVATGDGGRSSRDLTPFVGLGVQRLAVGEAELFLDTWQARFVVRAGGALDPFESAERPVHEPARAFQIAWKSARAVERDELPFGLRETSPLSAAVSTGAAIGDGTAFAVVQGTVMRVDLTSGRLLSLAADWIPGGLLCQPLRAPEPGAVLFACSWERSQGYGGYVLRSAGGAPPIIEKAFSDDGSFVADDDGALGFVGSCRAETRSFDAEERARLAESSAEAPLGPVFCVRRGPGSWIERRVELGEGASLVGWVPRRDGTAAALALSTEPLPPPASPGGRVTEQGGVTLVRLYRELAGWQLTRPAPQPERGGSSGAVDRRFHARDDGSLDAWLSPSQEARSEIATGMTLDPRGYPVVHEAAPGMVATVTGGAFGVAVSRDGDLYETLDHGRRWRAAGKSPVPPGAVAGAGCSALGCALGPVIRLGWGDGRLAPRVFTDPLPEAPSPRPMPRLVCTPVGAPVPVAAPPPLPAGAHETLSTGWGDTLEVVRDAGVPEPAPPATPLSPARSSARSPSPSATPAAPRRSGRASAAVLRTHTLVLRPPFAPHAAPRRLNATDATFNPQRRSVITPLLGPGGEVDLLVSGAATELLVVGDRLAPSAAFEGRRWARGDGAGAAGLTTAAGHALLLGDLKRRLTLEDHGPGASKPPLFLGPEHEQTRQRPLSLARRDDGAISALVLDGPAPETAGVAWIDAAAASAGPVTRLAGWGTLTAGDDPRCRAGEGGRADRESWRALVLIDPAAWLEMDTAALPGLALGHQGMLLVRWGPQRVCLEALEAALVDQGQRGEATRAWSLVVRWGEARDRGAVVRTADATQEVACRVEAGASPSPARSTRAPPALSRAP